MALLTVGMFRAGNRLENSGRRHALLPAGHGRNSSRAACANCVWSPARIAPGALTALLIFLVAALLPRSAHAASHTFTLTVEAKQVEIGGGMKYAGWTYDGTIPGPLLRVGQGDEVAVHLINRTSDAHGLNIHAAQIAPEHFSGDPEKDVKYSFKADIPGVFEYHCNAIPILDHIAAGMYGMMIVDPKDGWPNGKANELTIVESEFYGLPNAKGLVTPEHSKMVEARPDFVVFNGALNKYGLGHPIPIKVGELVRMFFMNAGPNLESTIHIAGVVFSTVYPEGRPEAAVHAVDGFDVPPSTGAVFEFTVKEPGNYGLMDLNRAHQYKGATAILHATP
jgi:nitrite reductase (NO-forming)